jgi:hypothetical protein
MLQTAVTAALVPGRPVLKIVKEAAIFFAGKRSGAKFEHLEPASY